MRRDKLAVMANVVFSALLGVLLIGKAVLWDDESMVGRLAVGFAGVAAIGFSVIMVGFADSRIGSQLLRHMRLIFGTILIVALVTIAIG